MTNEHFDPVPIKNRNRFEWSHTEDAVTVRGGRTTLMWASGSIFNRKPTKLHIKFPLLCYRGEIFTTQDTRQRPVCCGQGGAAAALAHTRLGTDLNQTGDIASRSLFLNDFRLFFTICWLSNCPWTMVMGCPKITCNSLHWQEYPCLWSWLYKYDIPAPPDWPTLIDRQGVSALGLFNDAIYWQEHSILSK